MSLICTNYYCCSTVVIVVYFCLLVVLTVVLAVGAVFMVHQEQRYLFLLFFLFLVLLPFFLLNYLYQLFFFVVFHLVLICSVISNSWTLLPIFATCLDLQNIKNRDFYLATLCTINSARRMGSIDNVIEIHWIKTI